MGLLETGLPLAARINVARRDLGPDVLHELSEVLHESIRRASTTGRRRWSTRSGSGAGLDTELADRFVGMYVERVHVPTTAGGRQACTEL